MANTEKMEWNEERGLFVGILPDGSEITVEKATWEAVEAAELEAYPGGHPLDWQYMKSSGWKEGIIGGW